MIYVYGASGHAKVILEILELQQKEIGGLIDCNPKIKSLLDYEVNLVINQNFDPLKDSFILAIGNNCIRKEIVKKIGGPFITAIHPTAVVSSRSKIGEGTVLMAGVVVNSNASIGQHVILNTNCSVDHDCVLGDFVHLSPHVALAGNVTIGEGTHIGIAACLIPGIKIGKWATIGAGAVIIRDVPDYAVVVGNPGIIIKYNHFENSKNKV